MGEHDLLRNVALVLGVAGITTVVFQRLRQPVVLGYLLAGLVIGPHVPVPLVADERTVHTLADLGVILLMFSIGLEFSLRKLARLGPRASLIALVEVALVLWLGYMAARLLGLSARGSLFAGACVAISSTTVVAKAFAEVGEPGALRDLVFGVLVVEDLLAVLLLALLAGLGLGGQVESGVLLESGGKLFLFLVLLVVGGLLVVPRTVGLIVRLGRAETTLVAAVGIAFALALLARAAGYSTALGAFLAGLLVAESGSAADIERQVAPVRDLFGAIFFVAVGMSIDPRLVLAHWPAVLIFTTVVIAGKVLGVSLGAFLAGTGTRPAVRAGLSLAQIGEFSFIIAGLGATQGATADFLFPVAVAVSALTTLTTPWLIRGSDGVARWVDRKLPRPLQTFATLYGSWIDALGRRASAPAERSRTRRLVGRLLLDAAILACVVIAWGLSGRRVAELVSSLLGLGALSSRALVAALALALAGPFLVGIFNCVRALGLHLAVAALPAAPAGKADLAAAPRRAFALSLQLALALAVAAPLLALTQPFLPAAGGLWVLGPVALVLGIAFWRGATDLDAHVRAGAEVLAEAMSAERPATALDGASSLLPGLGTTLAVTLPAESRAVGRSLADLDLRGRTGATVLALTRGALRRGVPRADEPLHAGDVLALAGTEGAVSAAEALLLDRDVLPSPPGGPS